MQRIFSALGVLVVVVSLLSLAAVPVAGQSQSSNGTASNGTAGAPNGERIDSATKIISSSYDEGSGTGTIVLYSEIPQQIVISDSGAFTQGGVVEQRTVTARPDERIKVEMPLTETDDGFTGVSIATPKVLYAEPIEPARGTNPYSETSSTLGWAGGALAVALGVIGGSVYVRRQTTDEPKVME